LQARCVSSAMPGDAVASRLDSDPPLLALTCTQVHTQTRTHTHTMLKYLRARPLALRWRSLT
jgi:hypothetical protein